VYRILFFISFIGLILFFSFAFSSEKIRSIHFYEMDSFTQQHHHHPITILDEKTIRNIKYVFEHASKISGIVNMSEPSYKVQIGNDSYYLWIGKENGSIMKIEDTNTIYSLSEEFISYLNSILHP